MIVCRYLTVLNEPGVEVVPRMRFGYWKVLAIDYVRKNILFKYDFSDDLICFNHSEGRDLRRFFVWINK